MTKIKTPDNHLMQDLFPRISAFNKHLGRIFFLFLETMKCTFSRPFYTHRLVEQMYYLGVQSLSITIVIGFCMGMVMALNFGYGLKKFGGDLYVPAVVSLSIVRQLAPIFTSLLVAGRIGSGIAAELGAMNVTQQIDALRALGTSPIRVLVVPRFWAIVITLPLLTTLASILGNIGGMIICANDFSMPPAFYMNKVLDTVRLPDYISSLLKSMMFGSLIALIGCYRGLSTKGGTLGVGQSTTWVVVTSSIAILVTDFFFNKVYLMLFAN